MTRKLAERKDHRRLALAEGLDHALAVEVEQALLAPLHAVKHQLVRPFILLQIHAGHSVFIPELCPGRPQAHHDLGRHIGIMAARHGRAVFRRRCGIYGFCEEAGDPVEFLPCFRRSERRAAEIAVRPYDLRLFKQIPPVKQQLRAGNERDPIARVPITYRVPAVLEDPVRIRAGSPEHRRQIRQHTIADQLRAPGRVKHHQVVFRLLRHTIRTDHCRRLLHLQTVKQGQLQSDPALRREGSGEHLQGMNGRRVETQKP